MAPSRPHRGFDASPKEKLPTGDHTVIGCAMCHQTSLILRFVARTESSEFSSSECHCVSTIRDWRNRVLAMYIRCGDWGTSIMMLFVVAHALQLRDGSHAIRC